MMEPIVRPYLKLLNYLRKIHLSLEETAALIRRLETNSCRPEDYEVLIRCVEAHMELSADVLEATPDPEPALPVSKAKVKRQGAQPTRRWHRR
jgi:hypothetical protein